MPLRGVRGQKTHARRREVDKKEHQARQNALFVEDGHVQGKTKHWERLLGVSDLDNSDIAYIIIDNGFVATVIYFLTLRLARLRNIYAAL